MICARNVPASIELNTIDGKQSADAKVNTLDNATIQGQRMTTRDFWLSEHGIYLFLCFWTSILIFGKDLLNSHMFDICSLGATPSLQSIRSFFL